MHLIEPKLSKNINIYEQSSLQINQTFTQITSNLITNIDKIIQLYPDFPLQSLSTLCNKLYERFLYKTEIYEILADAEQIYEKCH